MIFQTFNHDYIDIDINTELHDCIICFDEDAHTGQLNYFFNFNKACLCNSWIHLSCLEKWYVVHSSCPICRQDLYMKHTKMPIVIKKKEFWEEYSLIFYYFLQYFELVCLVINIYIIISVINNILIYLQKHD